MSPESASRASSAAVRSVSAKPEPALLDGRARRPHRRLGPTASISSRPETQHVGLAGALAGGAEHLAQLRLDLAEPARSRRGSARAASASSAPGGGVERVALGLGPQQAVLVGLAVHGDQRLAHPRQRRRGHRGPTQEGARAPLGRDLAPEQQVARLDLGAVLVGGVREDVVGGDHAVDPCGTGARAHRARVGAPAEQAVRGR